MEQEIKISANMKVSYMYSFLFWHLHRSFQGIFGVCISLTALVLFVMSFGNDMDPARRAGLLFIGLVFTVINPILLLVRAQKLVHFISTYKEPIQYTFRTDGLVIAQGDEEQFAEWGNFVKVSKTPRVLVLYTNRNAGTIIAYQEMGDKRQEIEAIIAEGCKEAGITRLPASMKR